MSAASSRNARVASYLTKNLDAASTYALTPADRCNFASELSVLEELIPIKAAGFRGIIITAIAGMHIDIEFRASEDFYACNPRSIFEQGLHGVLQDYKIPCGKSDPLNVAKNINSIDTGWAKGKRPESAALAAVRYLGFLENSIVRNRAYYEKLVLLFFVQLSDYAKSLANLNVPLALDLRELAVDQADRLASFVVDCPEGGTIPQFIVGNLLKLLRGCDSQYASVEGVDESVFGTNTTSKKPADLWEVMVGGELGQLYEVTVKSIDMKRLNDCVDAIQKLHISNREVIFLCRLDHDVSDLPISGHSLKYKGIGFQFIDIKEYIRCTYICLTPIRQISLLKILEIFVGSHNRKVMTKQYWADNFGAMN